MKTTQRKMSVTRSKSKSIPKSYAPIPVLYQLEDRKSLVWDIFGQEDIFQKLGDEWSVVPVKEPGDSSKYAIEYSIVGGQDHHAFDVKVVSLDNKPHDIEWIYVRSVTGGQMKFIPSGREAHVIFAMAEEDAYMFCTNDPCLECSFGCKLGFEFYAYSTSEGLLKDQVKIVYSQPVNN